MVEGHSAKSSLSRSSDLVKGTWWRVFGITTVLWILTFFIVQILPSGLNLILTVVFGPGHAAIPIVAMILGLVVNIISTPIMLIGVTLLYFDLRIRKEAFDIEMMAKNLQ